MTDDPRAVFDRAVFDPTMIDSLTGHADDGEFALVFVRRYRRMLPGRVRRIDEATRAYDVEAAMDAALSLKVASSIVGAGELFELGGRIEDHLRCSDPAGAMLAAAELPAAAERAYQALTTYLDGRLGS